MKNFLMFFGLLAGLFCVNAAAQPALNLKKCGDNIEVIKKLRDSGVIKDGSYLGIFDLLKSGLTGPLAAKRRELVVNNDALNQRIAEAEDSLKATDAHACLYRSAELIRNLRDYANFATKSSAGLDKFMKGWQVKVYIMSDEATTPPAGMPTDLPPPLPK